MTGLTIIMLMLGAAILFTIDQIIKLTGGPR